MDSVAKFIQPGSVGGAALSLAVATIGAGVLALPSAFSDAGVLTSLVVMIVVAFFTVLSIGYLALCTEVLQLYSFESISRELLGPWAENIIRWMLIIYNFGIGVGYIVVCGELLDPFQPYIAAVFPFLQTEKELMVVFWLFVMLPLSFVRKISALNKVSLMAVIAIHFIVLAVIIRYFFPYADPSDPSSHRIASSMSTAVPMANVTNVSIAPSPFMLNDHRHQPPHGGGGVSPRYGRHKVKAPRAMGLVATVPTFSGERLQVHLASFDFIAVLALPMTFFAFDCQALVFQIYHSLKEPSVPTMIHVGSISTALCFGLYAATGLFGYLSHGQYVQENILNNYDPNNDPLFALAYGLYAIPVNLAFALVLFPIRDAIFNYVNHTNGGNDEESRVSDYHYNIVSFCLSAGCVLVAIFVPGLVAMFSLLGAVCCSTICFIFPALFRIRLHQLGAVKATSEWSVRLMWSMLGIGVFGGILGTIVSLLKIFQY